LDYEIPQLPDLNYVTSIEINTRFNFVNYPGISDPIIRDSMAIAVTAAHEFNHALQFGYRLWPDGAGFFHDLWFIESSATCMEEFVAPEVNDYLNYLDNYFRRTYRPFDESTGLLRDYGKVVLEIMLGVKYDYFIVRKVWENIRMKRALPALEEVLVDYQTDFASELESLVEWLYFIRERTQPGNYFPDAAEFPELFFETGEEIREGRSTLVLDSLPRYSFQWYLSEINVPQYIRVRLDMNDQTKFSFLSSSLVNSNNSDYYRIPVNQGVLLPFIVNPPDFPFVVVSTDTSQFDYLPYAFIADVTGATSLANTLVYPQPFKMSEHQPFLSFGNIQAGTTLTIFNTNGMFIRQLFAGNDSEPILWDLKNENGNTVGSGVYIYQVERSGEKQRGKLVIVR
jgi:hypothetical protein